MCTQQINTQETPFGRNIQGLSSPSSLRRQAIPPNRGARWHKTQYHYTESQRGAEPLQQVELQISMLAKAFQIDML